MKIHYGGRGPMLRVHESRYGALTVLPAGIFKTHFLEKVVFYLFPPLCPHILLRIICALLFEWPATKFSW